MQRSLATAWATAVILPSIAAFVPTARAEPLEPSAYHEGVKMIGEHLARDRATRLSEHDYYASNAGIALHKSLELAGTELNVLQRWRVKWMTSRAAHKIVGTGGFFEREHRHAFSISAPRFLPGELFAVATLPDDAFWGAKRTKAGAAGALLERGRWLLDTVPKMLALETYDIQHEQVDKLLGDERRFGRGLPAQVLLSSAVEEFAKLADKVSAGTGDPTVREIADIARKLSEQVEPFHEWSRAVDADIGRRYQSGEAWNPLIHGRGRR